MRRVSGLLCIAGLTVGAYAAPPQVDPVKLHGGLAQAIAHAEDGELMRVAIVLADQASDAKIDAAAGIADKAVRRAAVIDILKNKAEATQDGILAVLDEAVQAGTAADVTPLWIANMVVADVTGDVALELAARDDVWYVHLDQQIGRDVFPVLPPDGDVGAGGTIECGVDLMKAPEVWDMGFTGDSIVVGMIDTGLCLTHPDIVNQVWENPGEIPENNIDDDGNGYVDDFNGYNFWLDTDEISNGSHGTHTSGTVAGDGTNGQQTGMAPDAQIMVLEFWNNFSGETTVWEGHQYAVDNGADVVSASIGWPHGQNPDRTMWRMVVENTFDAGIVTVYAAGNEGSCCGIDSVRTPGDVPNMITVGATDCNDFIAGFSSRGPVSWENIPPYFDFPFPPGKLKPTISAPGVNTLSLSNNCSGYTFLSGTSMATPHVAGTVALMLSANPSLDHYQVKQLLKDTAIDFGASGPDNTFGHGRVDALAAVEAAIAAGNCPADFNGDGQLNILDFVALQDAFSAGDDSADIDGNGELNVLDFVTFQDLFSEGCP